MAVGDPEGAQDGTRRRHRLTSIAES